MTEDIPYTDYRRQLLAKLHIARKELLGGDCLAYRSGIVIISQGRTATARDLKIEDLEMLLDAFREAGWKPGQGKHESKLFSLRRRVQKLVLEIPDGHRRLSELCRKICHVDRVEWIHEVEDLKRLLGVLKSVRNREGKEEC